MRKKKEEQIENTETTVTQEETEVLEQEVTMGEEKKQEPVDPITPLLEQIATLQKEKEELIEQVKYAKAEQVSYRMRKDEETANLLKYASQDLISELIPLIDNFESAIKLASKSENPEVSKYLTGFQMMYQTFVDTLKKYGVEEINRVGQVFDSKLEQALVADNNPNEPDEIVLEVLQKGYKLKERVIRPASVKINQI